MGKRLSDYVHMYNPYYIITMHIIKSQNRGGGGGGGGSVIEMDSLLEDGEDGE